MYLFDRVSYKLSEREIEGYSYPGVASTMKDLLTYPSEYKSGSQFIWGLDEGKTIKKIKAIWHDKSFTGIKIMLEKLVLFSHWIISLFFCENFREVMYGLKHVLTLWKTIIMMQLSNLLNQEEKLVKKWEILLQMEKLTLRKFHGICLIFSYQIKLSSHYNSDIKSEKSLQMFFLNR